MLRRPAFSASAIGTVLSAIEAAVASLWLTVELQREPLPVGYRPVRNGVGAGLGAGPNPRSTETGKSSSLRALPESLKYAFYLLDVVCFYHSPIAGPHFPQNLKYAIEDDIVSYANSMWL